jgi:hypothetical protein
MMNHLKKAAWVLLHFLCFTNLIADEGMWTISNLDSALVRKMKNIGLQLSAEQIYSENKPSIKDAVMVFDNGCTAEFVSGNGLILTNHHCGRDRVQQVSSETHNYIRDGFWANSPKEEIAIKGLTVKFLIKSVDVTQLAGEMLKSKTLRKVMSVIEKQYTDSLLGYSASLDSYSTGQYIVSVYQVFTDVRLVGVPPESIGNFGGETDNFEWPRQSADFCVFRVYADKNNLPALYSENNKPYQPKTYLPISLKGVHENDFALTIGFPYATQRYISSYELREEQDVKNRATVITKGKYIEVLKKQMDNDESIRLKYSNKNFAAGNSYKLALGTLKLVNLSPALENKQRQETGIQSWINADSVRLKKYGKCLVTLQKNYELERNPKYAHALITGALFNDASLFGIRARNIVEQLSKNDSFQINKSVINYRQWYNSFLKDYDPATDKAIVRAMVKLVKNEVKKEYLPGFYKIIETEYQDDIDKYVDDLYTKSTFSSPERIDGFLKNPTLDVKQDPLYVFGLSVYDKLIDLKKLTTDLGTEIRKTNRLYEEAVKEKDAGLLKYPDANFSMRLTYGTVCGASPRDGLNYNSQTTLKGVIEKEDSANYEFRVSPRLKDLYYKKDFGRYSEKGQLYTCFLTNTDITGGNSGSPVINGKGELTGLAFDGNFESLAGNIIYEPQKNRSINVDIRYVLFVIDKFAKSQYILKELTIK